MKDLNLRLKFLDFSAGKIDLETGEVTLKKEISESAKEFWEAVETFYPLNRKIGRMYYELSLDTDDFEGQIEKLKNKMESVELPETEQEVEIILEPKIIIERKLEA